ncbi:MAG: flippase [Alistipes sp.]|nr:flippase [Alistipes sp.]
MSQQFSIKKNYIFNLFNTASSILFPLLAFPYAARIMGAESIGRINFLSSIIGYISILSCLGIPMYAIREIAKVRDNERERNRAAKEILILHTLLTLIGYGIVGIIAVAVPKIHDDISLFLLLSISIFFNAIGCEWFYQGIEDFKYITIRGFIVKTIALILLFVLVKTPNDIYWYAGYSVIGSVGNNIFNFVRLHTYIKSPQIGFGDMRPFRHFVPVLHIFILNLIVSLYINLNTIMLGFMQNDESVGLFTGATKIASIALSFVGALGTVMLPHLSNLLSSGNKDRFDELAQNAFSFTCAFAIPMSVGLIICAEYIIPVFCGQTYMAAIPTLRILAPVILLVGLSNVIGIQILYPQGRENTVILCTSIGAAVNITLNLLLIPRYSYNGAAISTIITELMITLCMMIIGRRYLPIQWFRKEYSTYLLGSALMVAGIIPAIRADLSPYIALAIIVPVGVIIYAGCLALAKDPIFYRIISTIRRTRNDKSKNIGMLP